MAGAASKNKRGVMDTALLLSVLGLVAVGLVMVYSASSVMAAKNFGGGSFFLKRQAVFALAGLMVMIILRYTPYEIYKALAYPILFAALAALGALLVPDVGVKVNGAVRWLRAGPVNVQPAEMAKLAVVIYLAYSMSKKAEKMEKFSVGIVPHLVVVGGVGALFLAQPDFGSAVMLSAVAGLMLFVGGARLTHLGALAVSAVPLTYVLIIVAKYRWLRFIAFLNPWENQTEGGYQIIHSLMAFGTGGVAGVGVGNGYQKLFYLPEPHTDFVFAVLGEEMGLWGVSIVVGLYCLLVARGLTVSRNVKDPFGRYLAFGITAGIGLQACVNMGVTMGLLPTKGLALPFISYGGSSLFFNLAAVGILENIAARTHRIPAPAPAPRAKAAKQRPAEVRA